MPTFIKQAKVVFPGDRTLKTNIRFDAGKVASVGTDSPCPGDCVIDAKGRLLTPGMVDVHIHGIETFRFDAGPDDLLGAAACFARFGTTTVLPTMVPKNTPDLLDKIAAASDALPRARGVSMPGLHLEGPFTALAGAGCDVVPADLALLDDILAAGKGRIRVMSLSPDTPGILPLITRLREQDVAPFVTHTRANLEQAQAALEAGATHATHFYNVFPLPPETEPGVRPLGAIEAFMAHPKATVDFIADGCHVHPLAIQLAVRAMTWRNVAIITDANIGAGLPPGIHDTPWGYPVKVEPGNGARIADPKHPLTGALAGSALTMDVGMANILKWLPMPPEQAWALATSNPARIAGLKGKGSLAVGSDADAVLWNDDLTPFALWVQGEPIIKAA